MTWIQTYTGRKAHPFNLAPDEIDIEDIARSLSRIVRFNGHTAGPWGYSVAQHSVLVSLAVPAADALWGLLHDAHEAYMGDVTSPLKSALRVQQGSLRHFADVERAASEAVAKSFGLPWPPPASVRHADDVLLATEARDLCPGNWIDGLPAPLERTIRAWTPMGAEKQFLARFAELSTNP